MKRIIGFSWPFGFENGRVATSADEEHLKDNIMNIIATGKLEVPMAPGFGCDLHRRVFDPVNTIALAQGDITEALKQYEPRAEVTQIEIEG
jgi:hypothetical protein